MKFEWDEAKNKANKREQANFEKAIRDGLGAY